jgi:nicotinamide mononucleotide (NMN) deamidase PncC
VTGVAGPDSEGDKPVGLTFIGAEHADRRVVREYRWTGDRAFNRAASVEAAIELATEILS